MAPNSFAANTLPGSALVGFGGMHLPGADDLVAAYVRWFLAAALPVLVDHAGVTRVIIVGGREDLSSLVPAPWRRHPALRIHVGLDRATYASVTRRAEHLVVSPGLASIYECAASRLAPLLQPGFNMSMVLQLRTVAATGYPHLASWPWMAEMAESVIGQPERDGIRHVATRIKDTIRGIDPHGETVSTALSRYVDRPDGSPRLVIPIDPALPNGATLLAAYLERLM